MPNKTTMPTASKLIHLAVARISVAFFVFFCGVYGQLAVVASCVFSQLKRS